MFKLPKFSPSQKRLLIPLLAALVILLSFLGGVNYQKFTNPSLPSLPSYPSTATVVEIIDGDTFKLDTGQSVRLVAISAPELDDPFGQETADYLTNLIFNQQIQLEYEENYESDTYGRLLAYVFLPNSPNASNASDLNVNLQLVRQGLAQVTIYQKRRPWKYQDELLSAQQQAQQQNLGIWGKRQLP